MKLPEKVRFFLGRQPLPLKIIKHSPTKTLIDTAKITDISLTQLLRAVLLEDHNGFLMAILPASHLIDFTALRNQTGRQLKPAAKEQIAHIFRDCEPGSVPPLPQAYDLQGVVDQSVMEQSCLYFEPGHHEYLFVAEPEKFLAMHSNLKIIAFAQSPEKLSVVNQTDFVAQNSATIEDDKQRLTPPEDIKRRIEELQSLPPMPEIAHRILLLRNNPHANIAELSEIVELDPSLSAQVIRYARSAFFGYRGKIDTVRDAITRVLGFDMVMNMSLGLATSSTFKIPADGPLGLNEFWRHSVFTATLSQSLCNLMPPAMHLKPGLAYLSGLLHNFGFLLLGHLFPAEFFLLNKAIEANPDTPTLLVEKRLLGIDHTEMGACLMSAWEMPEEVIVTTREHHSIAYRDKHATYANLVLLADHLLKQQGSGDASSQETPTSVLTALGIHQEALDEILQRLEAAADGLEQMARSLAA